MKCCNCRRIIVDNSIFCNWCGRYQLDEKDKDADDISVPMPKQLPSGAWRVQLRREGVSITENTFEACRAAAVKARRLWLIEHPALDRPSMALENAIDKYIESRKAVRSPSTIRGYEAYKRNYFKACLSWDIFDPELDWQSAINREVERGLSPKTVFNAWHLITGAFHYVKAPSPGVVLPRGAASDRPWLDFRQIKTFLSAAEGQEGELGALLALHSLRLSELLALSPSRVSLESGTLFVRGARVLNSEGKLVYKELNKTEGSRRDVPIVIPRLKLLLAGIGNGDEYLVQDETHRLYKQINRICKSADLPEVGVHGLRHSFASLAYHLGWKELSTMTVGGWSNSRIVHTIYTHNADLDADIQTMKNHFKVD